MCGRFTLTTPAAEWAALFELDSVPDFEPRYNIAPTQPVAAVRSRFRAQHDETLSERVEGSGSAREFANLRWGLVPHWAKEPDLKGRTLINARSETVSERPSFRDSYRFRRCLIVADGFYEWRRDGSTKTPYFITTGNDEPFGLAALWEAWTDKQTGEHIESTTLITTAADDYIAQLHHRMPVTLDPGLATEWLAGNDELIGPGAPLSPPLVAWPVDKRVNNARNDGEDLIDAAGEPLPR